MQKIPTLDRKEGLYLKQIPVKGRGLFCKHPIKGGEILETTPAVILNDRANSLIEDTLLSDYVFTIGAVSKKLRAETGIQKLNNTSAVVMGLASYCNHDEHPNAEILWEENQGTLYYMLRAIRKIPANTEICTSYGHAWFDDRENVEKV